MTREIVPRNKSELLLILINDQVIKKRQSAMQAFFKGLENLGLGSMIEGNAMLRSVLLAQSTEQLSADSFLQLVSTKRPLMGSDGESDLERKCRVFDWFMDYIKERENSE